MKIDRKRIEKYQSLYGELHFERSGLFDLIRDQYHPVEVLYPGCSLHITPAFFFPHVCFVDRHPDTIKFFGDQEALLDFVTRQRRYQRAPYIQFIPQDFNEPLPLRENQFDLLLALFTGGVSKACAHYLKAGGLLLTNNHLNDAVEATQVKGLTLIAIIQKLQGKYRLRDAEPGESIQAVRRSKQYLRQTSSGMEYIENERYYIFRKISPKKDGT